jgi:outer membrane biosynthesis protein TonB
VKNRILSLTSIATLAVVFGMISWGSAFAQNAPSAPDQTPSQAQPAAPSTPDTPPSQQTPQTQPTPTPDNPPATQQTPSAQTPSQAPDQAQPQPPSSNNGMPPAGTSATGTAADSQSFSGTVVKSGDKYMLKDDSGKTYDIDHQSDVAKFEGKRVRVKGVLDASGTKILVK